MPTFSYQGHRLHYRLHGRGELLLILPGNTASSACHEGELAHYSKHYQVAALDYLGTGRSERAERWSDDWWRDGARQAEALRAHLGPQRASVMGTSGGAIAALWMAQLFPESVSAVIADSFCRVFTAEQLQCNVVEDRAVRSDGQLAFWHLAHGGDWEDVVAADSKMLARFVAGGGQWLAGSLGDIACPVLLTGSLRDPALPALASDMAEMAQELPDCRLYLHPSGDHPFMWSQGAPFRAQADLFLPALSASDAGSWPAS